ncbi:MAG: hypothetical protein AAFZ06_16685, partial [Pseudomonadota bacterium]
MSAPLPTAPAPAAVRPLIEGPSFFCIGAQKAGTSWLQAMFDRHPDIHVPFVKEVHYWDTVRAPFAGRHR